MPNRANRNKGFSFKNRTVLKEKSQMYLEKNHKSFYYKDL